MTIEATSYRYSSAEPGHHHHYILPALRALLPQIPGKRIFEIGCGNGTMAGSLSSMGYEIAGIDASADGVRLARERFPELKLEQGSAYDDLAARYGQFPIVLSLEVVEHLYDPRQFARNAYELLEPQGHLILSTPFHGYWKNLALAITGKMDRHFTALWDHGHIKFWSERTLAELLTEAGFVDLRFVRVGRIAPLAKTMICLARRP